MTPEELESKFAAVKAEAKAEAKAAADRKPWVWIASALIIGFILGAVLL